MKRNLISLLVLIMLAVPTAASAAPNVINHPLLVEHGGPTQFIPSEMFSTIDNARIHFESASFPETSGGIGPYGITTYKASTYTRDLELVFWCGGLMSITYATCSAGFSWSAAIFQFGEFINEVFPNLFTADEKKQLFATFEEFLYSEKASTSNRLDLKTFQGLNITFDKALDEYYDLYIIICISLPDYENYLYEYYYYTYEEFIDVGEFFGYYWGEAEG